MAREVVCTTKDPNGPNDCRSIEKIGYEYEYIDSSGTKSPAQVHDDIKDGKDYYVEYGGSRTDLISASRGSTKYVRTEPNDTSNDNLLKIQDC